ncbi:MAG: hypothetical protein R3C20_11725 [Planctomycetaceae bacterium]
MPRISQHDGPSQQASLNGARASRYRLWLLVLFLSVLLFLGCSQWIDWTTVRDLYMKTHPAVFVSTLILLPLVGFPISVLLLLTGARFRFPVASTIIAVVMGIHTEAAWQICHSAIRPGILRKLEEWRMKVPEISDRHQCWFTAVFVTVPGLPYATKIYSLALSNLPHARYLVIVWLFHWLNALMLLGTGNVAFNHTAWLPVIIAAVLGVSLLTRWFLRGRRARLQQLVTQASFSQLGPKSNLDEDIDSSPDRLQDADLQKMR